MDEAGAEIVVVVVAGVANPRADKVGRVNSCCGSRVEFRRMWKRLTASNLVDGIATSI